MNFAIRPADRLTPYREWSLEEALPPELRWLAALPGDVSTFFSDAVTTEAHARLVYRGCTLRILAGYGQYLGMLGHDIYGRVPVTGNNVRDQARLTRLAFDLQSFVDALHDSGSM